MRFLLKAAVVMVLLIAGLLASGCQSITKTDQSPRRVFQANIIWMRATQIDYLPGAPVPQLFVPIFYKDMVIAGNANDNISAYNQDSGALVWRLPVAKGTGPAALADDTLYFGTLNGQFMAVEAQTGKVKWTHTTGAEAFSAPAVDDQNVYFLASDGRLHVLKKASGEVLWTVNRPSPSTLTIRASTQPLVIGAHVGVGFPEGTFVKFDKMTGRVIWERRFDTAHRFQDVDSTPIFHKGDIFISGYETGLYAISWDTGDLKWTFHEGGAYSVLLHGEHLYYTSEKGRTYKLDPDTAKVIWQVSDGGKTSAPLTFFKDILVQGHHSGDLVFREPLSGKELARLDFFIGLHAAAAPNESGDALFIMSGFGNLVKLDAKWVSQ